MAILTELDPILVDIAEGQKRQIYKKGLQNSIKKKGF